MQTRSAMHTQPSNESTPHESGPYLGFRILGGLLLVLLVVSMVLNQTFLNQRFVTREMTSSTLENQLLDEVHAGMAQYGLPSKMLTKSDADQVVRTVVRQAFHGEQLKVNLQPVTDQLAGQANSELAQFGISTSLLPAGTSAAITDNVNSAVNSRINTPQVTAFINGLQVVKTVVNVLLVVSALGLLIMLGLALLGHHLLNSLTWISSGALLVSGLLFFGAHLLIPQLAQDASDYSAFAVQCAADFQRVANGWLGILAIIVVICWGLRLIRSSRR